MMTMVLCCMILVTKFVQQLEFLEHHLSFLKCDAYSFQSLCRCVKKIPCMLLTWGWLTKELHLNVHLCTFLLPFWVWNFVEALKLTKSRNMSKFDLIINDFDSIDVCDVKYLPPSFDNDILFVLSHVAMGFPSAFGWFMNGMDKMCDKHPWYTTKTINIQTNFGPSFKCCSYIGQLQCKNKYGDYMYSIGCSQMQQMDWMESCPIFYG